MNAKISDSLPTLPQSLKSVSPFIQRADELRLKDPTMAYWCTYYAAQLGLDAKSHEPGSREYLMALITLLEKMKKDVGANDAIDVEAAGAAYVENFALKVFAMADNEDRKGKATRSTAKKFLAAASFLEVLRVFEKTNNANAQVNQEKIRYAKWKAADIAKAFREGRQPKPGSAEDDFVTGPEIGSQSALSATDSPPIQTPSDLPIQGLPTINIETAAGIASIARTPPHTPPRKLKAIPPEIDLPRTELVSPGAWSTVATPGSATQESDIGGLPLGRYAGMWNDDESPLKHRAGAPARDIPNISDPANGFVDISNTLGIPSKKVHFTPSTTGGLSSADTTPVTSPNRTYQTNPTPDDSSSLPRSLPRDIPGRNIPDPASQPLPDSSPSGSSRTSFDTSPSAGGHARLGSSPPTSGHSGSHFGASPPKDSAPAAPQAGLYGRHPSHPQVHLPPVVPPPPPSINAGYPTSTVSYNAPSNQHPVSTDRTSGSPVRAPFSAPSQYSSSSKTSSHPSHSERVPYAPYLGPINPPQPPPQPPAPLTMQQIAKAQKHCRFAISALEYEDAQQARKELHAALAVLGDH